MLLKIYSEQLRELPDSEKKVSLPNKDFIVDFVFIQCS